MTQGPNVSRLIRPGDFPRICEIDYMPHLCGGVARGWASRFEFD